MTSTPTTLRAAALAFALSTAACGFQTEEYGNVMSDCAAGHSCSCGTGNCVMDCPGGGCTFACTGYSNCDFACTGGGCAVSCENAGNCVLGCAGGDCDLVCANTGNCVLTECGDALCTRTCENVGNCL